MKKLFAVIVMIFLTCNSVFAGTVFVKYTNTGRPMAVAHGAGSYRSINSFGTNAPFATRNNQIARVTPRHYARPRCVNNNRYCTPPGRIPNSAPIISSNTQPSRFSKNYTVSAPKSYTRNGITYYN